MRTLDNGLTVIILERHDAPVFSFATHVNAGSAQEVPGITGLAHMFEHMAFKGTDRIGTTDWDAEKKALAQGRRGLRRLRPRAPRRDRPRRGEGRSSSRRRGRTPSPRPTSSSSDDEFGEIVDRAGGVGLNAFTASDMTGYFFSLPVEPLRAVGLPRVRALPQAGLPRVLQGARRRHGRAPHAHGEQPVRPPARAVPRRRLHRPSVRLRRRRLAVRPAVASPRPTPTAFFDEVLRARRTWSSPSSAT